MGSNTHLYVAVLDGLGAAPLWSTLRKRLLAVQTGFYDCDSLAQPRSDGAKIPGTVVICGGSVDGPRARVCHDHFKRVVIVEADNWLDTDDARKVQSWTQENPRSRIMQRSSIQGICQKEQANSVLATAKHAPQAEHEKRMLLRASADT